MSQVNILDPHQFDAVVMFLKYAYRPSNTFAGTVHFVLNDTAAGHTLSKYISVNPTSASGEFVVASDESPSGGVCCYVKSEKDILMGMLSGALDPMVVLMMGQIIVDNLPQLMAFSTAFDLTRAKYDEFRASVQLQSQEKDEKPEEEGAELEAYRATPHTDDSESGISTNEIALQVLPESDKRRMKRKAAIVSLQLLEAVSTFAEAMDEGFDKIKTTEGYKKADQELEEILQKAPQGLREGLQNVSKSVQHATFIAGLFLRQAGQEVISRLQHTAYAAPLTPEEQAAKKAEKEAKRLQEKSDLEAKLQQLKLENEQKEIARKQRLQKPEAENIL
eukprot:TRINITY_DN8206_c0_g1_i1.p1 TRINITY_DN8206_c0_g1~~TRINITY_DN8206_c0_g1_i1.p1  ORF type:complete len:334 (+),score=92.83 TRINITY_DN8206_c0_g1_i1:73-1074(+)